MDWNKIIQDNFAAIAALSGVLIGLIVSLIKESLTKKLELQQKELDSQKEYRNNNLVVPIITFIDETLQLMDNAYWSTLDGVEPNISQKLIMHRDKESMIKARVVAVDDELLSKSFDNLSLKYGHFWNNLRERDLKGAYDTKKEAQQYAGVIFDRVKPKLQKK